MTFEILKSQQEEWSPLYLSDDEYIKYQTKMDSGKIIWVCGEEIRSDKCADISEEFYDNWNDAVNAYITEYNNKASGSEIEFEMTDYRKDSAQYQYIKKINGTIVEQGEWCTYSKIGSDVSNSPALYTKIRAAWAKAVTEYKTKNGIETVSSFIDTKKEEIKEALKAEDEKYAEPMDMIPPMMETALPKAASDPCNFVEELMKAVATTITRINGIPNPLEILSYEFKAAKHNFKLELTKASDNLSTMVNPALTPMYDEFDECKDYFAELDAGHEEFVKAHANDIMTFNIVMADYTSGSSMGDTSYNSKDGEDPLYDPSADAKQAELDIDNIQSAATDISSKGFNDVTYTIISSNNGKNKTVPNDVSQHVKDALNNCFIPLRAAWEVYCKQNGLKKPYGWTISSGYRPASYNAGVAGSSKTSAHMYGYAIDVHPHNKEYTKLAEFIVAYCKNNKNVTYDQILHEYKKGSSTNWIHIGFKNYKNQQRKQYNPKMVV